MIVRVDAFSAKLRLRESTQTNATIPTSQRGGEVTSRIARAAENMKAEIEQAINALPSVKPHLPSMAIRGAELSQTLGAPRHRPERRQLSEAHTHLGMRRIPKNTPSPSSLPTTTIARETQSSVVSYASPVGLAGHRLMDVGSSFVGRSFLDSGRCSVASARDCNYERSGPEGGLRRVRPRRAAPLRVVPSQTHTAQTLLDRVEPEATCQFIGRSIEGAHMGEGKECMHSSTRLLAYSLQRTISHNPPYETPSACPTRSPSTHGIRSSMFIAGSARRLGIGTVTVGYGIRYGTVRSYPYRTSRSAAPYSRFGSPKPP
uniref:Uncharacterized protein n=1 Tax=Mycena chlorophos TaxID=658473 RepID=A0ABQ0LZV9_MYCCL|nr:predicted protein [Mycena chlorophos]